MRRRQAGQSERLLDDVRTRVGDPQSEARLTELGQGRTEWADEAYGGLRERNRVIFNDQKLQQALRGILDQPKVQRAWEDARAMQLIGPVPEVSTLSFESLQTLVQNLDDAASAAFARRQGNLGHRLAETSMHIRRELREVVPGNREIDAEYARRIALEHAVNEGVEWFSRVDTRGLRGRLAEIRRQPDAANLLHQLRTGIASELIAKLRSAKTNRNVAQELLDGSPSMQEKLELVFGSRRAFEEFMQQVAAEGQLARMKGPLTNSSTARRLMSQGFDPAELGIDMAAQSALSGPTGLVSALAQGAARMGKGAIARRTAGELGPQLMTRGVQDIEDLLLTLGHQQPAVGPWMSAGIPAAMGGLLGSQGR